MVSLVLLLRVLSCDQFHPHAAFARLQTCQLTPHLLDGDRARPYQTVKPLAGDLGLMIDTSCTKKDKKCVAKLVDKYEGAGNILICWEHGMLTKIATALGVDDAPEYPDGQFGDIWTLAHDADSVSTQAVEDCPGLGP